MIFSWFQSHGILCLTLFLLVKDTGLHYDRYLREVIDFLEKDEHFREKLHNTDMEDIKVKALSTVYFDLRLRVNVMYEEKPLITRFSSFNNDNFVCKLKSSEMCHSDTVF